jgi:hypothetical protein
MAKETVLELAEWVINMEDGTKTVLSLFDKGDTGLSTRSQNLGYHGPGRGPGFSINTLIDTYLLTRDKSYLHKAEKLIRRCFHPEDVISNNRLDEPEYKWFYTIFLKTIGKYLDIKEEMSERDFMYFYAREGLLHYVRWMADNEYPYLEKPEKLEFPTESWAAIEMIKSNVFLYGAKYSNDDLRDLFFQKASFFHDTSIKQLGSFKTSFFTRPVALLLLCGSMYSFFKRNRGGVVSQVSQKHYYGKPEKFIPQKEKAKKKALFFMMVFCTVLLILSLVFLLDNIF